MKLFLKIVFRLVFEALSLVDNIVNRNRSNCFIQTFSNGFSGPLVVFLILFQIGLAPLKASGIKTCSEASVSRPHLRVIIPQEKLEKSDRNFRWMDLREPEFVFSGVLKLGTSELSFSSHLIDTDRQIRSAADGKILYREMMNHFGPENLSSVRASWLSGTNFERFWLEIDRGATPEQAAFRTWSGRMASEFGFTRAVGFLYKGGDEEQRPAVFLKFVRPPSTD